MCGASYIRDLTVCLSANHIAAFPIKSAPRVVIVRRSTMEIQNMASQLLFPYTTGRALPWRQNEQNHILNHWRLECLLNCLLRGTPKKTSKLRVNGMCEENPPVTSGLTSQRASNAVNVSIWWRHHGIWPWIKPKSDELDRFSYVRQNFASRNAFANFSAIDCDVTSRT